MDFERNLLTTTMLIPSQYKLQQLSHPQYTYYELQKITSMRTQLNDFNISSHFQLRNKMFYYWYARKNSLALGNSPRKAMLFTYLSVHYSVYV